MYKLIGNTPYEQIEHARGQLANKLKALIEEHGEDARVYQLAIEYVDWWNTSFDDKKDEMGRSIWSRAEAVGASLEQAKSLADNVPKTNRVGKTIGRYVGLAAGATVNATIKGGRWLKTNGKPVASNVWNATKEGYKQSRSHQVNNTCGSENDKTNSQQSDTQQPTDDDIPY